MIEKLNTNLASEPIYVDKKEIVKTDYAMKEIIEKINEIIDKVNFNGIFR